MLHGAVVTAGSASQDALADVLAGFARVPLSALAATDLEAFDAVVVPRSVDAEALWTRRHQFARFLDRGGVLVAFGELFTHWVPGARWEPESPEDVLEAPMTHEHPLIAGLEPDLLWWHRGPERWCSHGHVKAPEGAELVVTNVRGDAWLYVDRVTTRGTIVVGSNLDLDTHLFHGSALARTLLERLVAWLEEEVKRTAALRQRPSDRIAYYYSGVHFQHALLESDPGRAFAVVPAAELGALDLASYPALLVPRESDQAILEEQRPRLDAYLRAGGTLISFEEVTRPWLPGGGWERAQLERTADGVLALARAEHPLLRALPPLARPWHVHGLLRVPDDAERLIWDASSGRAALALWPWGAGRVLAGTIDPDCHVGYGSELPRAFLAAAVAWATERAPVATPAD